MSARAVTVSPEDALALQQLAREQTKVKLMADIAADLTVCQIEGWPHRGYLRDLHTLIAHFCPCEEVRTI